jgi:SAM-dependent methyltransferase
MGNDLLCPICGSNSLNTFLRRKSVPVHQNLIVKDRGAATKISIGDLTLTICQDCSFIFNQDFEPFKLTYGEEYDNSQIYSFSFKQYVEELVQYLIIHKSVMNCRIVEVGSGNGYFLRKLVEFEGSGNIGYGFDPSYSGPQSEFGGRLKFEKSFYGPDYADFPADIVICRHVIEHVSDPLALLRTIRKTLENSTGARVFFEIPDVEWIFRNRAFWDFFYEHCSYFSRNSLNTAFEAAGFQVEKIDSVFSGQYLWLEAFIPGIWPEITKGPGSLPQLAQDFALAESALRRSWSLKIQKLAEKGRVALWGAAAKGTTFANLIDPDRKWITCIVDLNPNKQGRFIAGAGHTIISYHELLRYGVTTVIVMNPNYRQENIALLKNDNINIEVIDLTWSGLENYEDND